MKIVALGGSLRSHSYTYYTLEIALARLEAQGIYGELIDLRGLKLPFCNGEGHYPDYPDVEVLRQCIQSATGILIATPEYHGSVSGVLKNALDLLNEEHLAGKVVGLISVLGGIASTNAINTLRIICRQMHSWVLPEQVIIDHVAENFNTRGHLINLLLQERLNKLVDHLVSASRRFST